jgi:hypothetical protein
MVTSTPIRDFRAAITDSSSEILAERRANSKSRPTHLYLARERLKDLQAEQKSLILKQSVKESIEG